MEGRSLSPAFENKPIQREAIFWEHEGNAAVRVGDWKLVRLGRDGPWELYDLKADPGERNNLAAERPQVVVRLEAAYDRWWEEVLPCLENETASGPAVNPFKALYWKQFGGGPAPDAAKPAAGTNR